LLLELSQLHRDRGLRQMQGFGRGGHASFAANGSQNFKLAYRQMATQDNIS
jgi:hypothetical protein